LYFKFVSKHADVVVPWAYINTCCTCCSAHILTSDVGIAQTAQAAELFLSDGVIVTGTTTGSAVNSAALKGQSGA